MFVGGRDRKAHDVFFDEWVGPVPTDQFLYPYIQNCIGRNCCNSTHWLFRSKIGKRLEPVHYIPNDEKEILAGRHEIAESSLLQSLASSAWEMVDDSRSLPITPPLETSMFSPLSSMINP